MFLSSLKAGRLRQQQLLARFQRFYVSQIDKFENEILSASTAEEAKNHFNLYLEKSETFDRRVFDAFARVLVTHNELPSAVQLLQLVQPSIDIVPNIKQFNTLLIQLMSLNQFTEGIELYELMLSDKSFPNPSSFTQELAIELYASANKLEEAIKLYDTLQIYSGTHFKTFLLACIEHGKKDTAADLFRKYFFSDLSLLEAICAMPGFDSWKWFINVIAGSPDPAVSDPNQKKLFYEKPFVSLWENYIIDVNPENLSSEYPLKALVKANLLQPRVGEPIELKKARAGLSLVIEREIRDGKAAQTRVYNYNYFIAYASAIDDVEARKRVWGSFLDHMVNGGFIPGHHTNRMNKALLRENDCWEDYTLVSLPYTVAHELLFQSDQPLEDSGQHYFRRGIRLSQVFKMLDLTTKIAAKDKKDFPLVLFGRISNLIVDTVSGLRIQEDGWKTMAVEILEKLLTDPLYEFSEQPNYPKSRASLWNAAIALEDIQFIMKHILREVELGNLNVGLFSKAHRLILESKDIPADEKTQLLKQLDETRLAVDPSYLPLVNYSTQSPEDFLRFLRKRLEKSAFRVNPRHIIDAIAHYKDPAFASGAWDVAYSFYNRFSTDPRHGLNFLRDFQSCSDTAVAAKAHIAELERFGTCSNIFARTLKELESKMESDEDIQELYKAMLSKQAEAKMKSSKNNFLESQTVPAQIQIDPFGGLAENLKELANAEKYGEFFENFDLYVEKGGKDYRVMELALHTMIRANNPTAVTIIWRECVKERIQTSTAILSTLMEFLSQSKGYSTFLVEIAQQNTLNIVQYDSLLRSLVKDKKIDQLCAALNHLIGSRTIRATNFSTVIETGLNYWELKDMDIIMKLISASKGYFKS